MRGEGRGSAPLFFIRNDELSVWRKAVRDGEKAASKKSKGAGWPLDLAGAHAIKSAFMQHILLAYDLLPMI